MDNRLMLICITILSLSSDCDFLNYSKAARRTKRVIEGEEIDLNSQYASIRYFVAISNGHNCDPSLGSLVALFLRMLLSKPARWSLLIPHLGQICRPLPQHLLCTGSMLTPLIVQTACHCVVHYAPAPSGNAYAVPMNVFENRYIIHPGSAKVEDIQGGVLPFKYVHHPKCHLHHPSWKVTLYDYALIVLETSMDPYQIAYAPAYTVEGLTSLWIELQAKFKVCLGIGFGTYLINGSSQSPVLRHGWFQAQDYISCYRFSWRPEVHYDYYYDATWFCTAAMPNRKETASGFGDSGGPVTCDNHYVGLVSSGMLVRAGEEIDKRMSTAFSVYENAVEYRQALMDRLSKDLRSLDMYKMEYPMGTYRPSSLPIVQSEMKAKSFQPISFSISRPTLMVLIMHLLLSA